MLCLLNDAFQQVKSWLMSSGLFISEKNDKDCGGVFSFFDEQNKEFSFLYPEITGYFISALKFLNYVENDEKYLQYAKYSCDWLIQIYEKYGSIIQGIKLDSPTSNFSYSFDSAICAKGVLDYYEISKNPYYLDYAKEILSDLRDKSIQTDGSVIPFKDFTTNQLQESDEVWYKQKACMHIKIAMPFFQINQYVDEDFLKIGNSICTTLSNFQNSDGSIRLHSNSKIINFHTLCYALEGLIYGYSVTKNEQYLINSEKAVDWCIKQISDDGSIALWFNSEFKSKAAYPIAQFIRILILIDKIHRDSRYRKTTEQLINFLKTFQASSSSSQINGGFYEEFYKTIFGWKKRLRLNSWTSMFALQAIYWYQNYDNVEFKNQIKLLY